MSKRFSFDTVEAEKIPKSLGRTADWSKTALGKLFPKQKTELTAEKVLDEPKYSTNWCHLPMEMRSECIKKMDYDTKNCLRATSHTEKSLVDAKKHFFETVHLEIGYEKLSLTAENTDNTNLFREIHLTIVESAKIEKSRKQKKQPKNPHKKIMNALVKILKTCEVDTFQITEDQYPIKFECLVEIEKCAPFRFKTFTSNRVSANVEKFLKNCVGVENILIDTTPSISVISIPAVMNAKVFQVTHTDVDRIYCFVQKLLGINADTGSDSDSDSDFLLDDIKEIAANLKDRVIYEKANELRIRTNEESKHILIRKNKVFDYRRYFLFSCTVISSDLLQSEYGKFTWYKEITQYEDDNADYSDEEYKIGNLGYGFGLLDLYDYEDEDYDDDDDDEYGFEHYFPHWPERFLRF